jgi:radical SAM protein with 4Fe4S-binding SPASM domain
METKKLYKNNIFPIPVGEIFGKENEELQLIYSPFTENIFIATPEYVEQLENGIESSNGTSDGIKEILESIVPSGKLEDYIQRSKLEEHFTTLSILPNNICNFSCSYCYSAQGRSNVKLDKEVITNTLEDFINPNRIKPQKVYISIFGGGEPLLSWDLVKHIIEYSNEIAEQHGFIVRISLVTNGSVVNDEILRLLKKYNISVTVSFEILEEIQNLQRGHYDKVSKNIDRLIEEGIYVRFRSTITKDNVKLQKKMIETVIERFPKVDSIMMEEVTDVELFKDIEEIKTFYKDLLTNFNEAYELGEENGKSIECSAARNINLLIDRFCPGELCLTPEGELSICSRISAPRDPGYEKSIYGKVENGHINIDEEKLKKLIDHNVYSKLKCENCFAKWHCGGGCYAQQLVYDEDVLNVACDFKREYTKLRLLKDLDNEYRENHNMSLADFINQNLSSEN